MDANKNLGALGLGALLSLSGAGPLPTAGTQRYACSILTGIADGTITTACSNNPAELADLLRRAKMSIKDLRAEISQQKARVSRSSRTGPGTLVRDRYLGLSGSHTRPRRTEGY